MVALIHCHMQQEHYRQEACSTAQLDVQIFLLHVQIISNHYYTNRDWLSRKWWPLAVHKINGVACVGMYNTAGKVRRDVSDLVLHCSCISILVRLCVY